MKLFSTLLIILFFLDGKCLAQQITQIYGNIDTADLRLTTCDFEKGANAMVLFDKAKVTSCADSVVVWRHIRIKLFNNKSSDLANVRLPFYSYHHFEEISRVEAQSIRLEDGVIKFSKLDPKQIFTETVDKNETALVFAVPGVKPGCIIEYRYKFKTRSPANFPPFYFQSDLPSRYSELDAIISENMKYNIIKRGNQPFVKDTSEAIMNNENAYVAREWHWAKSNIPSFVDESYMTKSDERYQCLIFQLHSFTETYGPSQQAPDDSWLKIASRLLEDDDFGRQLHESLSKSDALIKQALTYKTDDEKIACIFNEVKNTVKWNRINRWYTADGVQKAWANKSGNSTEVNLILYNLLRKAGINVTPMVVSTRNHGALSPEYAGFSLINKTVVCVPTNTRKYYILDATSKYNVYNQIPADLLNSYGIQLAWSALGLPDYRAVFLKNEKPALQNVYITAEIMADNKVSGSVAITSDSYQRATCRETYDKLGPDKYAEALTGGDNHLKIADNSFENMDVDSLPLVQNFSFSLQLNTADGNYIYFNPNLFTPIKTNPFLNEKRFSDIDLGNCNYYVFVSKYKLPNGYKADALPENITMNLFDKTIVFKRVVAINDEGAIEMRYSIFYKRSIFGADEYQPLRDFYKKMFEMLNEPIVLKKGT